ncbi:Cyclin-dependent kinase inhibitor 1B [Bagarius yarrelli]|uniref:Cyclin-dependent kinase inhibitor 1B n=1 Tax=Bagarius yarrelli TaxID=175774 RepID=A0A556TH83_BAGYA|nr:Cyclin-dependent kinase inhibitor 1B [Bagarius yarrelli]
MATTSSQFDHVELEGTEEGVKPRGMAVRRNLFGPVDHQQLQQDFHKLLCMSVEVAKQRWNFDFQSERPTPGSVEWEEMRYQDVPVFYHSCVVRTSKRRLEVPISAGGTLEFRGARLKKRAAKYRQSAITDFFTVKKRRFLHDKVSLAQPEESRHLRS